MANRSQISQLELWNSPTPRIDDQEPDLFASNLSTEPYSGMQIAQPVLGCDFAQRRPLTIIVVDDNEINRKIIRVILQKLGYECSEAENGLKALKLYEKKEHDYIFMDLDMPEMTGTEASQAIREYERANKSPSSKKAEIIAVTANISSETRNECRKVGMNGYLEKPITATMIREQLLKSWPRVRARRAKLAKLGV